jgi:hypothetical protein
MSDYVELNGLGVRYLLEGEATGGAFAVVEHPIVQLRARRPRRLPGGRRNARVRPGRARGQAARNTARFWNPGDEPARLLEIISPAGFEEYFRELAPLLAGDGPPDVAALGALQARYALTMDFSTIESLSAAHGLRPPE